LIDTTKLSNIYPSLTVKINVKDQFPETEIGKIVIVKSISDDPNGIEVSIEGGIIGNVIEVINSPEIAKEKIIHETHYAENKEGFTESVMKDEVIPKTIQSFLNADGGSLFLGVIDDPNAGEEKIIGLTEDRTYYESEEGQMSDEKFMDKLRSDLEDSLTKNLRSRTSFGKLLDYVWHDIDGKMILEIIIKSSDSPFFYKNFSKKKTEMVFDIGVTKNNSFTLHSQRKIDDFYIREGSRKKLVHTMEDFTTYFYDHFLNR